MSETSFTVVHGATLFQPPAPLRCPECNRDFARCLSSQGQSTDWPAFAPLERFMNVLIGLIRRGSFNLSLLVSRFFIHLVATLQDTAS